MRLDKFLKVSRILKRRTVAADAARGGKVSVNGASAKPGKELKVGDTVSLRLGSETLTFRVLLLKESVRKEDAESLYEILT